MKKELYLAPEMEILDLALEAGYAISGGDVIPGEDQDLGGCSTCI